MDIQELQQILIFWYKPNLDNFHKIIKAFKEYGFDVSEFRGSGFVPKKTFLRFPTAGFRTELLPSLAGDMSFSEAKENAENIELDGINVSIIGSEELGHGYMENSKRVSHQTDLTKITSEIV